MEESNPKPAKRKDPEIAAADWLLDENTPLETVRTVGPMIVPTGDEGFALADPSSVAEVEPAASPTPERPQDVREQARAALPPAPAVEQVWSRTAEWGTSLLLLGAWGLGILWLLYVCVNAEAYSVAGVLFVIGCLGGLFLCYPILITLERPVRVTPEQAARDYFGALSHHLPHHRRMWLLLSSQGRRSSEFTSFEAFKAFWARQLAQLRDGNARRFTPLVFQVEDFRAEKSAGRTEIDARFQLRVLVRGRRDQGPIWSFPLERTFARGPDGMWYLNDGTISKQPGGAGAGR